jgi:Transposase IS66 family
VSLKALLTQSGAGALPKSALGRACTYALKQWERLERYAAMGNGMVEIDNNWAENALRTIALGRKNWMQIGSEGSGPKVAAILSVLATCKRLGIKARDYLLEVLPRLSYQATRQEVEWLMPLKELTPAAWQRARARAEETLAELKRALSSARPAGNRERDGSGKTAHARRVSRSPSSGEMQFAGGILYTEVSIKQLQEVHRRCHPAEQPCCEGEESVEFPV